MSQGGRRGPVVRKAPDSSRQARPGNPGRSPAESAASRSRRLVALAQEHEVRVVRRLLRAERGVQAAQDHQRPGMLAHVVRKLVPARRVEREDPDADEVRVQHVLPDDAGDGLAVHARIRARVPGDRGQGDQSRPRRADVAVVDEEVPGRGAVGAVAGLEKAHFERFVHGRGPPLSGSLRGGALERRLRHQMRGFGTNCLYGRTGVYYNGR